MKFEDAPEKLKSYYARCTTDGNLLVFHFENMQDYKLSRERFLSITLKHQRDGRNGSVQSRIAHNIVYDLIYPSHKKHTNEERMAILDNLLQERFLNDEAQNYFNKLEKSKSKKRKISLSI